MGVLKACVLFLRAMLVPKAGLAIENLALRQQLAVCKQRVNVPGCVHVTGYSGYGFRGFGRTGNRRSSSCNRRLSSDGTVRDSSCIGAGNPITEGLGVRPSNARFVT